MDAMDALQHTVIPVRGRASGQTPLEKSKFSSLCNRLKAHLLVHIISDIKRFAGGPHTEAERSEQQHKFMRELLFHTNRRDGGRDIAIRFAEEYMLRHIGEGGYFLRKPRDSEYVRCNDQVLRSHNPALFQSSLKLADNNNSRKKVVKGLTALFKHEGGRLSVGLVEAIKNGVVLVRGYRFVVNPGFPTNQQSIFDTCLTDNAGNFVTAPFSQHDFSVTVDQASVQAVFDMSQPPIFDPHRLTDPSRLCVNKSRFGTLWWFRNTTPDLQPIIQ